MIESESFKSKQSLTKPRSILLFNIYLPPHNIPYNCDIEDFKLLIYNLCEVAANENQNCQIMIAGNVNFSKANASRMVSTYGYENQVL